MKNNFNQCLKWLLQDEGGYTNDKNDSGGPTQYGITIGDYRKYIKHDATADDVKTLTVAQAQGIYKSKYWDSLGCDDLPSGVDNAAFNYGVLAGIGRPRNDLKKFSHITDPVKLIDAICDEMKAFLLSISQPGSKNNKFRNGWVSRADRLRSRSKSLIKNNTQGPIAGPAAGITLWATLSQYITNHPYILAGTAVAVAVAVGFAVHYFRNRNVQSSQLPQNPVPVAEQLPTVTDTSMVG